MYLKPSQQNDAKEMELFSEPLTLTPMVSTILFVIAVLAGMRYRTVWKAEGPRWQLWVFGLVSGGCLLILGFIPVLPS